jgi:hypothetical protein
MRYRTLLPFALLVALPSTGSAQTGGDHAAKIRSALSAAPASLADHATVADFDGQVLREGTNGWVCMPDMPDVPNETPMCLDAAWRELIDAWQNRRAPQYTGIGIGYMLQADMPVSNTDPFATAPTADNQWIDKGPPHIMIAVSDHAMLAGLPTDPETGAAWVMWKGTPYAHIMIPTAPLQK